MNRDTVIALAREAGMPPIEITSDKPVLYPVPDAIERFFDLARAWEREECAKLCDQIYRVWLDCDPEDEYKTLQDAEDCAAAIRSRK